MKFIVLSCLLITPGISYAYLDPGSGNALVYLLISIGGACIYFLKGLFYRFVRIFNKKIGYNPYVNKDKADVVLFCEGPTYWYTFKPLVEELISRKIHFKYLTLDIKDPGLTLDNPFMHARFVGVGTHGFIRIANVKGRFFFATTPNIGCEGYPLRRPRYIEKMVHLSHTVGDITYLKRGSLDHYDVDLDIGPWCEKRMRQIETQRGLKPKEFHAVGLLYLDELQKNSIVKAEVSNPPHVLIAPSWGEKCCLRVHGYKYIKNLLESGMVVTLRPHPQSFRFDLDLINQIIKEFSSYTSFKVDRNLDARQAMQDADILISDSSSFRFDFAFLQKKPVITMLVPTGNLSTFEASLLGGPWETEVVPKLGAVVTPGESVSLPELVKKLIAQKPSQIEQLYDELVVNHGNTAKAVVDWIEAQK